jgi:predicted secreted protein
MACNKTKFVGRDVVLEGFIACGDVLPIESDWQRFGSMRTKEFTLEWDTTDATDADTVGALRENLATFLSLAISGDGTVKASGSGSAFLKTLTKHVANPSVTGGQPNIWLRMTFPDLTFTCFMLLSNMSRSAPYDDVVTYSMEASATSSEFGLIVEDTPDANADAVTSVDVYPTTMALVVGESEGAAAVVAPPTAPQGVQWLSDDALVATVTQNGVVTATGIGSAVITARSSDDALMLDTIAVTVS